MGRINPTSIDVATLLEKKNFYIPSYQRGYAWKEESALQLLDDLKNHFEEDKESDYYMGNIIVYGIRENLKDKLVIVDGQQRITTFMLMITALRVVANASVELQDAEVEELERKFKKFIFEKVNRSEVDQKIKIFSSRNEVLKEILNAKFDTKDTSKNRWMLNINKKYKNTNYCKNLIAFIKRFTSELITYEDFEEFINTLDRVIFVAIDIEDDLNVHKIFENINSTGVSLNLTDLTKNFAYILLEEKKSNEKKLYEKNNIEKDEFAKLNEANDMIEREISNIFEDYLSSLKIDNDSFVTNYLIYLKKEHHNKSNTKDVYNVFKKYIRENISINRLNLVNVINEFNEQISLIKYIEKFTSDNYSKNIYDLSLFLNKDNLTSVLFPFIYAVSKKYDSFENGEFISNGEFEDFIILMDKFFSRRILTNKKGKNFNKYMATLLKELDKLEEYTVESIEELLTVKDGEENSSLMPTRHEMLKYFRDNTSPYLTKNSKELKHILFRINFFMSIKSNEGISLTEEEYKKYTIEHIMPQNPSEKSDWLKENKESFDRLTEDKRSEYEDELDFYNERVHNWGNLTITQDNSGLSNKDFIEKLEIFEASTLTINKWVAEQNQWTYLEIEKRKDKLNDIIKEHF